jgi:hypothetical protein
VTADCNIVIDYPTIGILEQISPLSFELMSHVSLLWSMKQLKEIGVYGGSQDPFPINRFPMCQQSVAHKILFPLIDFPCVNTTIVAL